MAFRYPYASEEETISRFVCITSTVDIKNTQQENKPHTISRPYASYDPRELCDGQGDTIVVDHRPADEIWWIAGRNR